MVQAGPAISLVTSYDLAHTHASFLKDARQKWPASSKAHVQASDVQPYCQLASQSGFANRMFQTNQGPSYPAHQFLFGGTSAIDATSTTFASENTSGLAGCDAPATSHVLTLLPTGATGLAVPPCFERQTLSDLLDAANLSWRYYAASGQYKAGFGSLPIRSTIFAAH